MSWTESIVVVLLKTNIITNLQRSNFQAHSFHLVSPSPWPINTCMSLLSLTTTGVLVMHGSNKVAYYSDKNSKDLEPSDSSDVPISSVPSGSANTTGNTTTIGYTSSSSNQNTSTPNNTGETSQSQGEGVLDSFNTLQRRTDRTLWPWLDRPDTPGSLHSDDSPGSTDYSAASPETPSDNFDLNTNVVSPSDSPGHPSSIPSRFSSDSSHPSREGEDTNRAPINIPAEPNLPDLPEASMGPLPRPESRPFESDPQRRRHIDLQRALNSFVRNIQRRISGRYPDKDTSKNSSNNPPGEGGGDEGGE